MFALVACSGGSDSGSTKAADRQSALSAGGAPAARDASSKMEPPLTGEVKQKAEAEALAKYPGTVVKSEEDAEKPGMYAVEVKKEDGTSVEVYLDKSFKVTGTKQEGTEENETAG
ncbi:PepSY domain-containing protein [Streptomyces sp. NPDC002619]|uniref:PepSY domain-containing protein n=1 Tax=Streptomyces sp. NPDC002619 TaxID=3364655 RepID=UPI0036B5A0E8